MISLMVATDGTRKSHGQQTILVLPPGSRLTTVLVFHPRFIRGCPTCLRATAYVALEVKLRRTRPFGWIGEEIDLV